MIFFKDCIYYDNFYIVARKWDTYIVKTLTLNR